MIKQLREVNIMFLKFVMYKNVAKVYLVGGTKEAILTINKESGLFDICGSLSFLLHRNFWDAYKGMYHKGELIELKDSFDTASKIKSLMEEKYAYCS